jgi:hypothetical protein
MTVMNMTVSLNMRSDTRRVKDAVQARAVQIAHSVGDLCYIALLP